MLKRFYFLTILGLLSYVPFQVQAGCSVQVKIPSCDFENAGTIYSVHSELEAMACVNQAMSECGKQYECSGGSAVTASCGTLVWDNWANDEFLLPAQ